MPNKLFLGTVVENKIKVYQVIKLVKKKIIKLEIKILNIGIILFFKNIFRIKI